MSKGIAVIIWRCADCGSAYGTRDESDACCSQTLEQRVDAIEGWMQSLRAKPQEESGRASSMVAVDHETVGHEHKCVSGLHSPGECFCSCGYRWPD